MDHTRRTTSSDRPGDQDRRSRSPERRNRPETSSDRERRNLIFSRAATSDSPSSPNTNPMAAPEGEQQYHQELYDLLQQQRQGHLRLTQQLDVFLAITQPQGNQDGFEQHQPLQELTNRLSQQRQALNLHHASQTHLLDIMSQMEQGVSMLSHRMGEVRQEISRREEERQEISRREEERQERSMMDRAGEHLNIDLSEVTTQKWARFSSDLLVQYGNIHDHEETHHETKDLRLLGDILRGSATNHVNDEERNSEKYTELKAWVRGKWEEWNPENPS